MKDDKQMQINGLFASINTPPALTGPFVNQLPPYDTKQSHVVDEYPACPDSWMHGSAKASSYFVGVLAGRGMWIDFTANEHHTHHIAVVVSVQGVNPITGKKVTALNLEQYHERCPVHDIAFLQDRYCPTCNYCWPAQNYIATTTRCKLWIDGFRNDKGEVVQYIITEDETRGVAAQIIGTDRVWAIGFAFYLSKEPKPIARSMLRSAPYDPNSVSYTQDFGFSEVQNIYTAQSDANCKKVMMASFHPSSMMEYKTRAKIATKKLEIGAGARIKQDHGVDPNPIDFWQPEPAGLIYVSYVSETECGRIIAAGKRQDATNGPLMGLKVGN